MKRVALILTLLAGFAACESEPAPEPAAAGSEPKAAEPAPTKAAPSPPAAGAAKWKVTYSGDLSGEIQGTMVSSSGSRVATTALGKSGVGVNRGKQSLQATFLEGDADSRPVNINITLADGTRCKSKVGTIPKGKITNPESKSFAAEVAGQAYCDDKKIDFKASFAK